jgi:hypothetical protein
MPDGTTRSRTPQLAGRVSDLQARVREHTTAQASPEGLVAALRSDGLDADIDTTGPGGRPLVRIRDADIALLFDAADGSLAIVDVRRPSAQT